MSVEARSLHVVVWSSHPEADEEVADAIARVLSRYTVDLASGVEIFVPHHGSDEPRVARASGENSEPHFTKLTERSAAARRAARTAGHGAHPSWGAAKARFPSSARSPRSGLTLDRQNRFGKSAIVFECQLQVQGRSARAQRRTARSQDHRHEGIQWPLLLFGEGRGFARGCCGGGACSWRALRPPGRVMAPKQTFCDGHHSGEDCCLRTHSSSFFEKTEHV
jgi:hypothetical protein